MWWYGFWWGCGAGCLVTLVLSLVVLVPLMHFLGEAIVGLTVFRR